MSIDYDKFMQEKPILLREIEGVCFYEHPEFGDKMDMIVVSHETKKIAHSTFFDLDDMYLNSEYIELMKKKVGLPFVGCEWSD